MRLGFFMMPMHPMHRTLKAETARPPADSLAEQQARFDAFRHDFNVNRPHEAPRTLLPM